MKILVFSDSHGRLGAMLDALEQERPQRVFFLGDNYRDGQALMDAYPDLPMELVKGNCDWDSAPDELIVEAGGVKFLLTHGHRYGVKSGTDRLAQAAREKGVNVAGVGHTHEGLNMPDRGVWLFNPGVYSNGSGARKYAGGIHNRAGYGVVIVSDGKFRTELK